ncbi:histone deacetylase [Streptomyces oryzae]|uniref:Histone deacetylase n=1 Tax=Streptomyces oryzae TaxID=1434886 RepID=A0ABS3XKI6_9ACTN|nr:histone deacetylase [Streptomyces oryzae]
MPRVVRSGAAWAAGRPQLIWYAAYGSNMHRERLRAYVCGGQPEGAARWYPGCRDGTMPAESVPVELPGAVYFATTSPVWGGGRAFYDPAAEGRALAVAHLVTPGQFSDLAAQEMYREPGEDLDLTSVLAHGRAELGEGRYETLVCAGELDGHPVLTFTAAWRLDEVAYVAPAGAYLRYLASGLLEAGGWSAETVARYLARAARTWSAAEILELVGG